MIISASRRTDLPAFYSEWFINRIQAGFCCVVNPLNAHQVSRVSLKPEDVTAIVLWSKNPAPLIPSLPILDRMGYRYYFQYTLNDYSNDLEQRIPPFHQRLDTFKSLANKIGQQRTIWRYDPIIFSPSLDESYHLDRFNKIATELNGSTNRVMISILDMYDKVSNRLEKQGQYFNTAYSPDPPGGKLLTFLRELHDIAGTNGMEIFSCAEETDFADAGIQHGHCIDTDLIRQLWHLPIKFKKDKGQRKACGCSVSKDIGANSTCLHECVYCYSTMSLELSRKRYKQHDPTSPFLWGTGNIPAEKELKPNHSQLELL
ncbi:Domain of unknown function DUF1848 [Dehalogenimonas lykanthroporepellens BL-DC-9]|nr:Domain of unknown function DUF1848 [Dehalogenimonas lykanthroporepellens BL-DC-9]